MGKEDDRENLAEVANYFKKTRDVTCVNKKDRQNPHERILFIGGINRDGTQWKMSQQEAIEAIKSRECQFRVKVEGVAVSVIVVTGASGHEYLRTRADEEEEDNLLSLPECK